MREDKIALERKMMRYEGRMRHFIIYTLFVLPSLFGAFPVAGQAVGQGTGSGMSDSEIRRRARLFDQHIVKMGETAFSIARGYAISPATIAEDNPGVDLTRIKVGQVLLIRKRERGKTEPAQVASEWQSMVDRAADGITGTDSGSQDASSANRPSADTLSGRSGNGDEWWRFPREGSGWGRRELRDFGSGVENSPQIALMLPFNQAGRDFTDFYKGFLLGLENLKAQGHSAIVNVYDSERSPDKVRNIVRSTDFIEKTDLIIGPVYEEEIEPAVRSGESFGIPVVSPLLATVNRLDGEALYQMAPDSATKYDKLRYLFEGNVNIIMVSSGSAEDDAEFRREIEAELSGRNYRRFTVGQGDILSLIDWERPNVLIVLAGSELSVNMALSTISSSYSNASARRDRRADISVVGTSKWANYNKGVSLDQNLLFKLNAKFVTNYYIDRSDKNTRFFEARYIEVYNDVPMKAAFRGYDAAVLFAGALFKSGLSLADRLEKVETMPLATPYRFVQRGGTVRHVNDQWTLVAFSSDYSVKTQ